MIYELKNEEFTNVTHLLKGDLINLEIEAVVNGYNPGWVFVDKIEKPKTAMIWSKGIEGFYFVGNARNTKFNIYLNDFIDEEITPRARIIGLENFEFNGTSKEWDETFKVIFNNRNLEISKQFVYKHKAFIEDLSDNSELESDYILKKVSLELLKNKQFNTEYIESAIYEWWDTIDNFLNHGIGFSVFHKDTAVCSCVTSFMTKTSMESHIKTKADYRKNGLATIAVSEFLKYCKENHYLPYWDCMEMNFGSRALADKLGYKKVFEYYLYDFKLE